VLVTARDRQRLERLWRAATVVVLQGLGTTAARELLEADGLVIGDEVGPAMVRLTGGLPGELKALARGCSSGRVVGIDDVIGVALGLATTIVRTQGRAASEALAGRLIEASELASPRRRGEIALFVHRLGGTTSTTADDRVALIEEPVAALAEDDDAITVRAQLHAALARELYHGDVLHDGRDPRAEATTALALGRRSGDVPTLASCLRAQHDIEWRPGTAAPRLALVDEIVALLDGSSMYEEMASVIRVTLSSKSRRLA